MEKSKEICAKISLFLIVLILLIVLVCCFGGGLSEEQQVEKHQEFLNEAKIYVETIDKNIELVDSALQIYSQNPLLVQETYDIVKQCQNNISVIYENDYHKYFQEEFDLVNDYRTKTYVWLSAIMEYLETKSLDSNNTAQRRAEKVKELREQILFLN